jgi:hypothetical protein
VRRHSCARNPLISEQERYKGTTVYREKSSRDNAHARRAICSSSCEARTCTRTRVTGSSMEELAALSPATKQNGLSAGASEAA